MAVGVRTAGRHRDDVQPGQAAGPEHRRVHEHVVAEASDIDDPARRPGGAAGLEDPEWPGEPARQQVPDRRPTQPVGIEGPEPAQVSEAADVMQRVETQRRTLPEPERRAGVVGEVPAHHPAGPLVEADVEQRQVLAH